jgi:hypothetical protein
MNDPAPAQRLAGKWAWGFIPLVLMVEVAVVATFDARAPQLPPATPVLEPAPVATAVAEPKPRRKSKAERKREAREAARAASVAAGSEAAPAAVPRGEAKKEVAVPEDEAAPRPVGGAAPDDAAAIAQGPWVGVHTGQHAADIHIALKITGKRALVHFHSGSAAAPQSPGCYTARWSYNPDRTHLEIAPQAWLWRVGQTTPLRLSGWVNRENIVGEVADMAGCRGFTLHRQGADGFPADCR